MSTCVGPDQAEFISASEALRRHPGLNRPRLFRLGMTGAVRVQLPAGTPPRFAAEDLVAIKDELVSTRRK
jgi:hypothetical protein